MPDHDSILAITNAIRDGEQSAVEVMSDCLGRIKSSDQTLGCFRETYEERALGLARMIDDRLAKGDDPGPLSGIPIAVKDNMVTDFGRSSAGSRMLEDYHSPFTATAIEKLELAGAIVVGKTHCDEFAMGSSTENCSLGTTKNPWDTRCVPGGSSGGSAAAVASQLVPAALGSDTGGSIRQPASFCGIVGLKPSYGRISRSGLIAFGSSLDQIGPMTKRVEDAALLLQTMAGKDRRDSTCADVHVPNCLEKLDEPLKDLKLGVPKDVINEHNDDLVNTIIQEAIDVYRDLGAEIVEIDLPLAKYAVAIYYVISAAEASGNLARYDGIRYGHRADLKPGEDLFDLYAKSRSEGFGDEVKRRIMLGTFVLSSGYYDAYYKRALQARRLIKQEFDQVFETCHAILGPTAPTPAFPMDEMQDPLSMYLCDVYTTLANIGGHCGISIPAGFAQREGRRLPVGLQLQGKGFDEARLLRIARMFEMATSHHDQSPELITTNKS
ncbi:MAG: Asp-tRNA(Asn)/Glu-tRNA(Gln) amidotransferase subunit GatA [Planctomycetota bacterium]|nr:Asp-tRNA(Asn)/Glu-tRNA(Gln) amidotransferase subunit GatA [Planctomycetota bacterium]